MKLSPIEEAARKTMKATPLGFGAYKKATKGKSAKFLSTGMKKRSAKSNIQRLLVV